MSVLLVSFPKEEVSSLRHIINRLKKESHFESYLKRISDRSFSENLEPSGAVVLHIPVCTAHDAGLACDLLGEVIRLNWEIVGPKCPINEAHSHTISIGRAQWKCLTFGCGQTVRSHGHLTMKDMMAMAFPYAPQALPPMPHVVDSGFEREVLGKYVGTAAGPFEAARQAEVIREATNVAHRQMAKPVIFPDKKISTSLPSDWEIAERMQKQEFQNKQLRSTADKLVRVVAGLNLQDQSIATQREVREALSAMMKVLKNGQEPR